jgi:PIN domain nuclease of toxin-antitoxin system
VRLLLDTCAFLWWLADDRRLGRRSRAALADPAARVFVSAATVWEIAIKSALGKLDAGSADLAGEIVANGFRELPVSACHAAAAGALPRHHEDPFDRLLIAQAAGEGLTVVTRDPAFAPYGVPVLAG